jgi:hypothetical protein
VIIFVSIDVVVNDGVDDVVNDGVDYHVVNDDVNNVYYYLFD